jgi:glycine betaine/proline transport system substrate-binding protein
MRRRVNFGLSALCLLVAAGLVALPARGAEKKTLKLGYVAWSCCDDQAHLAKAVLEKLGYKVDLTLVDIGVLYQAVSQGDVDFMVCAWLPTTHKAYFDKLGGKLEKLAVNFKPARLGWVVPTYVTVSSIEELNAHGDRFDWRIVGIDPGAGLMQASERTIKAYGLSKFRLVEGSDAAMTAALQRAVEEKKWVVVTGWTPHWKWAKFDLKYLDDPKKSLGEEEVIWTVTRPGFQKDHPEATKVLTSWSLTDKELAELMVLHVEKGDGAKAAATFIERHPDRIAQWAGSASGAGR